MWDVHTRGLGAKGRRIAATHRSQETAEETAGARTAGTSESKGQAQKKNGLHLDYGGRL